MNKCTIPVNLGIKRTLGYKEPLNNISAEPNNLWLLRKQESRLFHGWLFSGFPFPREGHAAASSLKN